MLSPTCQNPLWTTSTVSRRHGWKAPTPAEGITNRLLKASSSCTGRPGISWVTYTQSRDADDPVGDERSGVARPRRRPAATTGARPSAGPASATSAARACTRGRSRRRRPASGTPGRSCAGIAGTARSSAGRDAGSRSCRCCGGSRSRSRASERRYTETMSIDSITTGSIGRSPAAVGSALIVSTTAFEASSATSPKIVCLPCSHSGPRPP